MWAKAKVGLVLAVLFVLLSGVGRGGEFPVPPKPYPPFQHNPKIESSLEIAMQAQDLLGGEVHAMVELAHRAGPHDLTQLRARGAVVEAHFGSLVRARIPWGRLEEIADLPQVQIIRRPYRPTPLNEALGPIGAVLLHLHGFTGQGTRVAVIDVGFKGLSQAIARGALSREAIADLTDYSGEGLEEGTNHGTAVAELVHSVAPRALLFLKKVGDEVDLGRAVDDSLRQGIQIIVHSVGWFNTNFTDGTGVIDEIAARAYRAGILWVNAAGNHAQQHWSGPFRDRDGDGWAEFTGLREELEIQAGFGELQLFLTWNDWPRSCQDYDLFLYDVHGNLVASSQNYQSCTEPPTEELSYLVLQPGVYYVRVLARNGINPVSLKIFSANARLNPAVPAGSLPAPADSPDVLSVGAISISRWESGPLEPFSSQGPTADGRVKPDLMGPDNVRTITAIGFLHRFRGTSAAAPLVAGAAALLLSQNPGWTAQQIWEELERSAQDMGEPGKDNAYGSGRLSLSLGRVSAEREIDTAVRPGDQAIQGGTIRVTVRAKLPPSRFGGLVLHEKPPPGFQLIPLEDGGAEFDPEKLEWVWPIVEPGGMREISYLLHISQSQPPGSYRLEGQINGEAVEGEEELEVIPALTPAEVIAHWDSQRELIDLELDRRIDKEELEQAIDWWSADMEVPATGGKVIGPGEIERLVAYHLTGTAVGQLLPSLPAWDTAAATRTISIVADGSLLVTVEIEARSRIYGLRLSESWPQGWRVEPVDSADAIFKGSTNEWLWARNLEPRERLAVRYRVRPPDGANTVQIKGLISSALPRFSKAVGGVEKVELEAPDKLELTAVRIQHRDGMLEFWAEGRGIEEISVQVFDLSGRRIYDSGWVAGGVMWAVDGPGGARANGVYLYLLSARGLGGERHLVGKVVILR